ncbi:MAG: amidohydrolase family protein [Phycisphaerales bacterium]|nr:amidohydrolase family protein [Phycisphaerales bacterium]
MKVVDPSRDPARIPRFLRVDAAAIVDGAGFFASPGSILLELLTATDRQPEPGRDWHTRTLAVGPTSHVLDHEANRARTLRVIARPECTLIPGLVNAHTHLDLTHIGPRPHDPAEGFVKWVDMVRAVRHTEDEPIAASVRRGIELSIAAGTVAIGDIAGAPKARSSLVPWRTLREMGGRGVSFLEFFSIGKNRLGTLEWVQKQLHDAGAERAGPGPALGLQPHAPNTVALSSYRRAIEMAAAVPGVGLPLCTHLAESPEERRFIAEAAGPQRDLLERFGLWTDDILDEIGRGRHPVAHLARVLAESAERTARPMLVAHVNDADDAAIETLARTRTTVVYCPHASDYFAAATHFGPHRYRDMLAAGVPVALGTDSIINLPPDSTNPAIGISILREMRLLHQRDNTDPTTLLRMATHNGATALGLERRAFHFGTDHPTAGLLAVRGPSFVAGSTPPELLLYDNHSGVAVMAA